MRRNSDVSWTGGNMGEANRKIPVITPRKSGSQNSGFPFPSARRGFALPIVVVVAFFIALFLLILTLLNHGEILHLDRTEKLLRCGLAIRSIYQKHAAMLAILPWAKRPCREKPWQAPDENFDGVDLSLLMEDAANRERTVDLWIAARYGDVRRAAVYRVEIAFSILQKMNKLRTVFFSFLDEEGGQEAGQRFGLRQRVDDLIHAREEKKIIRQETVIRLQKDASPSSVLESAGLAQEDEAIARDLTAVSRPEELPPAPVRLPSKEPPAALTKAVANLDLARKKPRPTPPAIDPEIIIALDSQRPTEAPTRVEFISAPVESDPFEYRELLERLLRDFLHAARRDVKDRLKQQRRRRGRSGPRGHLPIEIIEEYIPPGSAPRPGASLPAVLPPPRRSHRHPSFNPAHHNSPIPCNTSTTCCLSCPCPGDCDERTMPWIHRSGSTDRPDRTHPHRQFLSSFPAGTAQ